MVSNPQHPTSNGMTLPSFIQTNLNQFLSLIYCEFVVSLTINYPYYIPCREIP